MSYEIMITEGVREFLDNISKKDSRICRDNLRKLEGDPFPGGGRGDKEKLKNSEHYRIHISREYTGIYLITKSERTVQVIELMTIDKAHKKYGHYVR